MKTQKTDKPGMLLCKKLPQNIGKVIQCENLSYLTGHIPKNNIVMISTL